MSTPDSLIEKLEALRVDEFGEEALRYGNGVLDDAIDIIRQHTAAPDVAELIHHLKEVPEDLIITFSKNTHSKCCNFPIGKLCKQAIAVMEYGGRAPQADASVSGDALVPSDRGVVTEHDVSAPSPAQTSEIPYFIGFDKTDNKGDTSALCIRNHNTIEVMLYGKEAEIVHDLLTRTPKPVSVEDAFHKGFEYGRSGKWFVQAAWNDYAAEMKHVD